MGSRCFRQCLRLAHRGSGRVPMVGYTAVHGLRDKGQIQPGQRVLITGVTGGVGTFAAQIAKAFGAHVTGVCTTRNVDMVRSIGADLVMRRSAIWKIDTPKAKSSSRCDARIAWIRELALRRRRGPSDRGPRASPRTGPSRPHAAAPPASH